MTYEKIQNLMIAAELARFGARTGVIEQLTGLASTTVRKLIRDITGRRPKSGQLPYSAVWYEKRPERLMHCALFLRLFTHEGTNSTRLPGRIFLNAYTHYTNRMSVAENRWRDHRLCVSRAYVVIQLLRIGEISYRSCKRCGSQYVEGRNSVAGTCQFCRKSGAATCIERRALWPEFAAC